MGRLLFRNSWPMCGPDGSTSSSSKGPSREAGRAWRRPISFQPSGTQIGWRPSVRRPYHLHYGARRQPDVSACNEGGAIEFLTKPSRDQDQDLLDGVQLSLSRDRFRRENEKALADLSERIGWLGVGEREITIYVARGRLSKEIAGHIGIAGATVKIHLIEAMRKMNARSLPELGGMADRLKLMSAKPQTS
jgi:DNA-binding CsgD family transcriptional regulator